MENTFYNAICKLYSNKTRDIISIINTSIYVTNIDLSKKDKVDTLAIHSGFSYKLQSGKEMELLFLISEKKFIRQMVRDNHRKIPQILGRFYFTNNTKYFSYMSNLALVGSDNADNFFDEKYIYDITKQQKNEISSKEVNKEISLENFKFYDHDTKELVNTFPVSRKLEETLFFDGFTHAIYEPNIRRRDDDDDIDYFYEATDGQFGEDIDSEDGWLALGRD